MEEGKSPERKETERGGRRGKRNFDRLTSISGLYSRPRQKIFPMEEETAATEHREYSSLPFAVCPPRSLAHSPPASLLHRYYWHEIEPVPRRISDLASLWKAIYQPTKELRGSYR